MERIGYVTVEWYAGSELQEVAHKQSLLRDYQGRYSVLLNGSTPRQLRGVQVQLALKARVVRFRE